VITLAAKCSANIFRNGSNGSDGSNDSNDSNDFFDLVFGAYNNDYYQNSSFKIS
jgi:hypothetical protein